MTVSPGEVESWYILIHCVQLISMDAYLGQDGLYIDLFFYNVI